MTQAQRKTIFSPVPWLLLLVLCIFACGDPPVGTQSADIHGHQSETPGNEHTEGDEDGHDDGEHDDTVVELSAESAERVTLRLEPVVERALATELTTTGQVDFDHTRLAHVSPRITGRVARVEAVLGQQVVAGQSLAQIDSIELGRAKASFLQARAKEELARTSYERAQGLLADRIVAEQEVLEAEAALREASAGLRTREETLRLVGLDPRQIATLSYDDRQASLYPLRAPFAGTIVERHATLGELVTPERNLFTIADLRQVWIWIDVFQRDLGSVHLEDQAQARVDAFPDAVFEGTVSYLSARVDPDTRTVRARLDMPNLEGRLRPGMFVEVDLLDPHAATLGTAGPGQPVVSRDAVVREGDATFVFVATDETNRFERRPVRLGRKAGDLIEVLDGLAVGDRVVVEGSFVLKSAASKESLGGGHSH